MEDFSLAGFTNGTRQDRYKKKTAFSRSYVYAAVLINLTNLQDLKIKYNKNMMAMEDIDLILRTTISKDSNRLTGLIVKCHRFTCYKLHLNHGGVMEKISGESSKINERKKEKLATKRKSSRLISSPGPPKKIRDRASTSAKKKEAEPMPESIAQDSSTSPRKDDCLDTDFETIMKLAKGKTVREELLEELLDKKVNKIQTLETEIQEKDEKINTLKAQNSDKDLKYKRLEAEYKILRDKQKSLLEILKPKYTSQQ